MNAHAKTGDPHRRFNPLTQQWVLVSPQRVQRPWQGHVDELLDETGQAYDPACYLCPGNVRASGGQNPKYDSTFVFDNDFAALLPDTPRWDDTEGELFRAQSESGRCRVVCFSPQHDLTLARMSGAAIRHVVDTLTNEYVELGAQADISSVQIFENRGAIMGCSNPHPHGQIWANRTIPNEVNLEVSACADYYRKHNSTLLHDYLNAELVKQLRIVCANDAFVVLVPFWAVWPFETLLISRRPVSGLDQLTASEREALADILRQVTIRYDNLFRCSFPYTMGFHQRPTDGAEHAEFHLHAHFYPPLLRSATIRKYMVGYELLAGPQRDITPETAAEWLRAVPEVHYALKP